MGLKVMQNEIATSMGFQSVEELEYKATKLAQRPSKANQDDKAQRSLWELYHLSNEVLESIDAATNILFEHL